jgi:hypothetical protein
MKALQMANDKLKMNYITDCIDVSIPIINDEKIKLLSEVYLPLYDAGIIDIDYMLSMIPNANADKIKESINESLRKTLEELKKNEVTKNE